MNRTPVLGWTVHLVDGPRAGLQVDLAATVPGVVHQDLVAAGAIDDPVVDCNEDDQHWVGESDWEYRTAVRLDAEGADRLDLVFEGIDTLATVRIDGDVVLRSANMHRTYRVDVTHLADGEEHSLTVHLAAPTTWARRRAAELGDLPNPYDQPYNVIRKMAANFGWDWGPRLTTSGIWKPVRLEAWSGARVAALRPTVDVTADGTGVADVVVDLEWADDQAVEMALTLGDGAPWLCEVEPGTASVSTRVEVPDVRRWWPRGYGDQPRYPLTVEVARDGGVLTRVERRVGFRTVVVDTSPEPDGSRWAIVVNGRRIWVRGLNWIPDDCFPSRVGRDRLATRIDQAVDANANLLRVWGGGIHESDDFYDLCDERGVLVWQDFLFACAAYPEEELAAEVEAEAVDAIDRLMWHPSLVLWNGNNENHWGWWDWGWRERLGDRSWGLGFYEDLLPRLVAERDPGRPYLRGSPSSGDDLRRHPNDPAHGPIHIWDVWNDVDYTEYRRYSPRFVSEFGFQAPPAPATLREAITSRPLRIDGPDLLHRQKAFDGHAKLDRALRHRFGEVTDVDDWQFLTQVNQARAIDVGVGHLRRLHGRCAGAIWWQLNDCWPAVSWSVVDSAGRRKLAWYALRRAFADRTLVVEPREHGATTLVVAAVNDGQDPWTGPLVVERIDVDGAVLARQTHELDLAGDDAVELVLSDDVARAADPRREMIRARAGSIESWWSWVPDRELGLTAIPDLWFDLAPVDEGYEITLMAPVLLRDLCVVEDLDDPEAIVDDQLVTLLPGEFHSFRVAQNRPPTGGRVGRPVLRAVNLRR